METVEKSEEVHEDFLTVDENKNAKLLSELFREIENFLINNKQEISNLADVIKRIFYSGLTCKLNVSRFKNILKSQFFLLCVNASKKIISCEIARQSLRNST